MSIHMPTPHEVCLVFRGHPNTLFFGVTAAEFALAVAGMLLILAVTMAVQLAVVVHVVGHTYRRSMVRADDKRDRANKGPSS